MPEALLAYHSTIMACVALAALILLQVLVADFASIRAKHTPGMPITDGHGSFLFRATRALGNTNETLALFLLLVPLAILLEARAQWVNALAWVYVGARVGHMVFYYARKGFWRSTAFGISLGAQVALLVLVVMAAF